MDSSDKVINHQNLETTSAIRAETVTGSHLFKIYGYPLNKGIGIGKSINSDVFTVGGFNWILKFYPYGESNEDKKFISVWLELKSKATDVKVQATFTILEQNGVPSNWSFESIVWTFNSTRDTSYKYNAWGFPQLAKRTEFELSECLKDDVFTVKCTITIIKGTHLEATSPYGVTIPQSNLKQNLTNLLENGKGADVTFLVKEESFKAHRCILAARSAVFNAELFGCMKEKWVDTITVEDIEATAFKSTLYFIYSDSLPDFEETSEDCSEIQNRRLMAQNLLVAADRYELERLRLMCEDLLCKNLEVSSVATTLILADQHNCNQLKAECLKFMSSPEVFKAVAQTDGFLNLIKICPSILKDM